jgi:Cu-processing system permease protein
VFMLFGAGLTAGLLGQIAEAINSDNLENIASIATWALPFEALYQAGLADLSVDTVGFARLAINLGPFGGAQSGGLDLWVYSLAYLAAVGAAAVAAFARRDL